MFSGIIDSVGAIQKLEFSRDGRSLELQVSAPYSHVDLGESIATNGICLTVAAHQVDPQLPEMRHMTFFLSPETLDCTAAKTWKVGSTVNLERALRLSDRLSGHLVQGHVDGVGTVVQRRSEAETLFLTILLPSQLSRYVVHKGSISINGVSLTINHLVDLEDGAVEIQLALIPHTVAHTNLGGLNLHDLVNIEVDVMAKYAERLCQTVPRI